MHVLYQRGSCLQGLDNAKLRAAAEHCRKLLSTSDMQRSLSAAKKGTPQAPKSSGQLGRRWQSVAGYALSSLAPHDVHAKSSHRRVMPRWAVMINHLSGFTDPCSLQHFALCAAA